jgi:predicted metal-binding protein
MKLPFQDADPAHEDFQYLEDLSTAYWYSEVLFAGLELKLFDLLEHGCSGLEELATASCSGKLELLRLLEALERLELIHREAEVWFNSQVARLYLVPGSPSYMGDFFLYRRRLQPTWMDLASRVSGKRNDAVQPASHDDDYEIRTFRYVRALDQLAKEKAGHIATILSMEEWEPPILDVGGGAGTMSRALIHTKENGYATLFDLPEVIAAARLLYADKGAWKRIQMVEGDFRGHEFGAGTRFGLVVLSNFLHAYGSAEAQSLLRKSLSLLSSNGLVLIHDYFPDRLGRSPGKGALYDLNMMLNTYDGECHRADQVVGWLRDEGMGRVQVKDLATDSSIILAGRQQTAGAERADLAEWEHVARQVGFRRGVLVPVERIATASWVRMKCKCGCPLYGKNLQCPPAGMDSRATREMLESYSSAIVLEGSPPSRDFHRKLLQIERRAFLAGFHKAFVLGAGPCPVCESCPEDGRCRNSGQARPSMEGSGIDVYSTARAAGIRLKPVPDQGRYVKYIGLLLLE